MVVSKDQETKVIVCFVVRDYIIYYSGRLLMEKPL